MRYEVVLKPRARKDLRRIPKPDAARVVEALGRLEDDLSGDVKRLTAFAPGIPASGRGLQGAV